ncbi:MAG: hypothetical protein JW822_00660 [Spirochaetales bacterium]|nr:hypothetical protein [Spirochaetales bacterium]
MHSNSIGFRAVHDNLSSIPLPDSIADVQRMKGIQLALTAIGRTVTGIEKLLYQSVYENEDRLFITHSIKREQKWMRKILKTVKIKNRYPLLGDRFILNMASSAVLELSLEKLACAKISLNPENTSLFLLLDMLREFKQKLQYNAEVIYISLMLYKSDYALSDQKYSTNSQKQRGIERLVFYELFTLVRRYCTRLTSSLLPADLKSLYLRLFVLLLKAIKRLHTAYPIAIPSQAHNDLLSIIDAVLRAEYDQIGTNTLYALRSLMNKILNNPHCLIPGACAFG